MKPFGFLAYPGVEELDLVGPWEMATMWRDYADGPDCVVVAAQPGAVPCAKGLSLVAQHGFDDAPALSALLIPGGFAAFDVMKDAATLDYVRRVSEQADHMLSVCSGAFILAAAGLLEGKRATTHWKAIVPLREAGIDVVEERFVRDGSVWTSAGVSAGIDLILHFIAETQGAEAADIVQHNAEYYPVTPPYGDLHKGEGKPAYMQRL
ncbi:DJ-1/PfpI family protein [Algihabitans albus]|uniref:DJ-1/PfpI family protein n=1 Tax=Algihabitans albus TaxID=2164067 RepID=UPI000E5D61C6|nr:DJ-1/PfpI family protein [Algihabitans albus]